MVIHPEELASKEALDNRNVTFHYLSLGNHCWLVEMQEYKGKEGTYTAYFDNQEESMQVYNMLEYTSNGYDLPFLK